MSKTAFMFPGQGSQCVGMGADFYEACPKARAVYDMASELIGIDMKRLCFGKMNIWIRQSLPRLHC